MFGQCVAFIRVVVYCIIDCCCYWLQSQNIQEFIPLINQLIAKYKQRMGPFLQEVFMSIIHTILKCSSEPYDPRDEEVSMTTS